MNFMLNVPIESPEHRISYRDKIMVVGSCFTEHMGGRLSRLKFPVLQNPNGILFDPLSISNNLLSYIDNKQYTSTELIYLNELWQSWAHHSVFSGLNKEEVLSKINHSQQTAHDFLRQADWLIITPGTSFSYQLTETGNGVANCHRAPAQWFIKHMASIDEIVTSFQKCLDSLFEFNPGLKLIFTVSPVRHIRDGVIENNRSKARLLEAIHLLVENYDQLYYFPAYELVIDVLRDYRFYDIDMVHPNYAATEFVFERFAENYIDDVSRQTMEEVKTITTAFKHKPLHPNTLAHQDFLNIYMNKIQQLQQKNPHLDLGEEMRYFSRGMRYEV